MKPSTAAKVDRDIERKTKVYVGGLNDSIRTEDILKFFKNAGKIKTLWVARAPPGFAFVTFEDPRDAKNAVEDYNGLLLMGHHVRVEFATRPNFNGKPSKTHHPYDGNQHEHNQSTSKSKNQERNRYHSRTSSRSHSRSRSRSRSDSRSRSRSRSGSRSRTHSRSHNRRRNRNHNPSRSHSRSRTRSPTRSPSRSHGHTRRHINTQENNNTQDATHNKNKTDHHHHHHHKHRDSHQHRRSHSHHHKTKSESPKSQHWFPPFVSLSRPMPYLDPTTQLPYLHCGIPHHHNVTLNPLNNHHATLCSSTILPMNTKINTEEGKADNIKNNTAVANDKNVNDHPNVTNNDNNDSDNENAMSNMKKEMSIDKECNKNTKATVEQGNYPATANATTNSLAYGLPPFVQYHPFCGFSDPYCSHHSSIHSKHSKHSKHSRHSKSTSQHRSRSKRHHKSSKRRHHSTSQSPHRSKKNYATTDNDKHKESNSNDHESGIDSTIVDKHENNDSNPPQRSVSHSSKSESNSRINDNKHTIQDFEDNKHNVDSHNRHHTHSKK